MAERILVAYASKAGATKTVAEAMGQELGREGASVDVVSVQDVKDMRGYDAVVVGSGIRAGNVYGDAVKFLSAHSAVLAGKPVAYFIVCATMQAPTDENRRTVMGYVDHWKKRVPQIEPIDVGLFAGAIDYGKIGLVPRTVLKLMKAGEGDWRDWDAIRTWAAELRRKLA